MKSYLLDNTKVLDLRKESKLSVDDAKLIDRIEPGVRKEYNGLIEQLISRNKLISTGLLLSVTCRNTISSSTPKGK